MADGIRQRRVGGPRRAARALLALLVLGGPVAAGGDPAAAADAPVVSSLEVIDPGAGQPVPVVVEAAGATAVVADVVIGFAAPVPLALVDDGTGGDEVAGDGRWTGQLAGQPAGTLVRARATATGPGGQAAFPAPRDEARHRGIVVARPPVDTGLPVIDWYIAPADHQALVTEVGAKTYRPAVLAVDGTVYDGVRVRLQGGAVTQAQPKKNLRFKMAKGHDLVAPALSERPLEEFVLDAESLDPLGLRSELAWRVVDAAGGPTLAHRKVRLERDGAFEGLYTFLEEYDDDWMEAAGIDDGLLYESEDEGYLVDFGPEALGGLWDQKEPEDAPHDALAALAAAVDGPPGEASTAALLDQVDLADLVTYYATTAVIGSVDAVNHNIWLVHDPASGRWSPLQWDLDLTFGVPSAALGGSPILPSIVNLADALSRDPRLTEMVLRRIRTLADEVLGPDGVPAWIDELDAAVAPDRAADAVRWPKQGTTEEHEAQVRDWVAGRRRQIDEDWATPGGVPPARTGADRVVISEIRSTGDAAGDFVELANPGAASVDVSGWTLSGATTATLPAGAVVPAGDRIVVPAAAAGPGPAARDRLVVGALDAPLPDGGGELVLHGPDGTVEARAPWQAGAPWPVAAGGRSLERVDLAVGVPGPGAWRASAAVGGTPGAAPGPQPGLTVETWLDGGLVTPGLPVPVEVEVSNGGPTTLTDVTIGGLGPACARTVARLAPGAHRTHRCAVEAAPSLYDVRFVQASATAAGGATATGRAHTLSSTVTPDAQAPVVPLREVLLDPIGGLRASWSPAGTPPTPRRYHVSELAPGRARPLDGSSVAGGSTASARVTPPVGEPVRLATAAQVVITGPSSTPSPAVTPRTRVLWPATSSSTWVQRALRIALRRAPTTAERAAWTEALADGTPPAALLDQELARGRWAAQEAKVARLYVAFFDRPAETAGLAHWSAKLAAGTHVSVVAQSFARSAEFRARFGAGSASAFVDLVYRNVLGREADADGRAYWVAKLQSGRTRGWVMAAFSESAEGRTTLAPETDPVVISYALTGEAWSDQAHDDAVAWLRSGGSRRTVVEAARTDDAFATRPLP